MLFGMFSENTNLVTNDKTVKAFGEKVSSK